MEARTEIEEFKGYLKSRIQAGWSIVTSELENSSSKPLTLIAEPYGTHIVIPVGGKCEIVSEEPPGIGISLTISDDKITVWGAGGLVEVFQDGEAYGTTGDFVQWRKETQSSN